MKLIHYCREPFKLEPWEYPEHLNFIGSKPVAFWFSVEDNGLEDDLNWREWCEAEKFCLEDLAHSYEITLKENSRILHLKTAEEIWEFTKKYPIISLNPDLNSYGINWEQVKKEYQGIIISPYQWECRLSPKSVWYYGWDCSSGCLWDLDCIKDFTEVKSNGNEEAFIF